MGTTVHKSKRHAIYCCCLSGGIRRVGARWHSHLWRIWEYPSAELEILLIWMIRMTIFLVHLEISSVHVQDKKKKPDCSITSWSKWFKGKPEKMKCATSHWNSLWGNDANPITCGFLFLNHLFNIVCKYDGCLVILTYLLSGTWWKFAFVKCNFNSSIS